MNASAELVKVCGDSVRSGPLEESNKSKVAVTASPVSPEIRLNRRKYLQIISTFCAYESRLALIALLSPED